MPVERSIFAFRNKKKNCAQSVFFGFQIILGIPDEKLHAARKMGHGRAKEGLCGALHAALELSQNPNTVERLKHAFNQTAGSLYCREIRAKTQLSCEDCVQLAVAVLAQEEHIGERSAQ